MPDWDFRDPWFLLVALLAPIVYHLLAGRRPGSIVYSALSLVDKAPGTWRSRLANLPALLIALAVVAMAVALAGPRTPDDETRVRREGIAVVMVVDRSGSMDARDLVKDDLEVNRLNVVKRMFKQFVLGDDVEKKDRWSANAGRGRPDDVIGLVGFARYADGLCPLTLDHGNLVSVVNDLKIASERSEDGTAMGEGLALAVERLRRYPAHSKIAILLTDGVNNAGDISPEQAAELAAAYDVKVYCIGAGTNGLAAMPVTNPFTGQRVYQPMRVEIDEQSLKMIAEKTGGRYFRATDVDALADIYRQIDSLERTEITEVRYLQYREHYADWVWASLGCIAASGLLGGSLLRRLP